MVDRSEHIFGETDKKGEEENEFSSYLQSKAIKSNKSFMEAIIKRSNRIQFNPRFTEFCEFTE